MSAVIETSTPVQSLTGNFNGQTLNLRQITVEEYDAMIESGIFDENDKFKLLNGAIIEKMPKGKKHFGQTFNLVAFPDILLNVSDFLPVEKG